MYWPHSRRVVFFGVEGIPRITEYNNYNGPKTGAIGLALIIILACRVIWCSSRLALVENIFEGFDLRLTSMASLISSPTGQIQNKVLVLGRVGRDI